MNVVNTAKAFGCHDVVQFDDEPTPRHLDYLDLLKVSGRGSLKVNAVAEFQSRPLLYIVSGDQLRDIDNNQMLDFQCLLANRGERAYLGILSPGELNVYPVNLDRSVLVKPEAPDHVFKTILDLMTKSSKTLIETYNLNPMDVLSFLGRALFFRFLWDRKIVRSSELSSVCQKAESPGDCFCNIKNSVETCRWLDETFNGDLLPFSSGYTDVFSQANKQTGSRLFLHLLAILKGWKHAGIEA
jgi:hypothetical protein